MRWSPGGGCCDPCPPVPIPLSDDGVELDENWEVSDLVNVSVQGTDDVSVIGETLTPVTASKTSDTLNGAHLGGTAVLTVNGASGWKGNNRIKFTDHATIYKVTKAQVGTALFITPALTQNVADATQFDDVTEKVTFPSVDAYYIRHQFRMSGTYTTKIKQGNSLTSPDNQVSIDFSAETITVNSETAEDIPQPDTSEWHWAQLYVCPTHRMGEAAVNGNPTGYPAILYSTVVVDDSSYTVDNLWQLEASGAGGIRYRGVYFYPAEVTYSGSEKTTDCGRRDLFACPWMFWKQYTFPTIDLDHTGFDEPLVDGLGATVGDGHGWFASPQGEYDNPQPLDNKEGAFGTDCQLVAYRCLVLEEPTPPPDGIYYVSSFGVVPFPVHLHVRASAYYARDEPTSGTPYPKPTSEADITYRDLAPGDRSTPPCDHTATNSTSMGDAVDMGTATFSLAATLTGSSDCGIRTTDTTATWNHPP